jgi:hypothetical protein
MARLLRSAAVICLLVLTTGCGRKSEPLPPIIEYPETTTDLRVYQEASEAVLEWSYPQLTRAGRQLTDLGRIEVWRLDLPPGQEQVAVGRAAEEMRRQMMLGRGRLLVRLEGNTLAAATRGDRLQVRDQIEAPGPGGARSTLWYAVRSRRRDGTPSGLSNIVTWQPQPVPPQVAGLEAKAGPEGITLSWEEVADAGYLVERRADEALAWQVVSPPGLTDPRFLDATARPGIAWQYRVRTVIMDSLSPPDRHIEVPFPDIYPPQEVSGFICLPERTRVRLQWDRASEARVTYTVFRRGPGETTWIQLTRQAADVEHVDEQPPAGLVEYAVKAVDEAGNESDAVYCSVQVMR